MEASDKKSRSKIKKTARKRENFIPVWCNDNKPCSLAFIYQSVSLVYRVQLSPVSPDAAGPRHCLVKVGIYGRSADGIDTLQLTTSVDVHTLQWMGKNIVFIWFIPSEDLQYHILLIWTSSCLYIIQLMFSGGPFIGLSNKLPFLMDRQVAFFGGKKAALFRGQRSWPFWGTNKLHFLRDKQVALFEGQKSCPFWGTNKLSP